MSQIAHGAAREIVYVLDFGAQYSQLIARKVRECGVYCEILPFDTPTSGILAGKPKALIFSGGPASVYEQGSPACARDLLESGVPILGICYGHQLIAHLLGGEVRPGERKEYGRTELEVISDDRLFLGIAGRGASLACWMSHGDTVWQVPQGFVATAKTHDAPVAAMADPVRRIFGVQFHPEVVHTPFGKDLLRNFVIGQAGCQASWSIGSFIEAAVAGIRGRVGEGERVLLALSGGVDSSVCAALLCRALGHRLTCILVDHGFMRKGEAQRVVDVFRRSFDVDLVHVDAADRFLAKLEGISDPEEKRRRIGEEFIRVFEEHSEHLANVKYLAQGTLYPDVIESGGRVAATIKTHHNVGGLPDVMKLPLIEPLRDLFKDEVRRLGRGLGLPENIVGRHPFPGPGLAIRVIGEVTKAALDTLREADAIAIEEIRAADLYDSTAQAFVVLLPVRSVGVMGDQRTYANTAVLRVVTTEDFMTADWARLPYDLLARISNRIINEVPGINRVAYDISSKPPATVEWE